ncbi:hypothetical protein ES703_28780 [subsurface metagenome]
MKGRLPKILGKAVLVVLFILILAVNIIPEFSEELFGKKGPPEIFKTPTPTMAKWGFFLGILGIIAHIYPIGQITNPVMLTQDMHADKCISYVKKETHHHDDKDKPQDKFIPLFIKQGQGQYYC